MTTLSNHFLFLAIVAFSVLAAIGLFFLVVTRISLIIQNNTAHADPDTAHIYWIYKMPFFIWLTDHMIVVSCILLFQYRNLVAKVGEPVKADLGLYEITENPSDRWKFRTPTLRNVALSAPYMHDGSLASLREVVEFYNGGGIDNALLDPLVRPLHLQESEIDALVVFLQSLTGSNVPVLVADAFAAPVGDISRDDPHWAHRAAGEAQ